MSGFDLSDSIVDTGALRDALRSAGSGGFCSFEGWVRDNNDGRDVDGLDYEAYEELARSEGDRIVREAIGRFGIVDARCVHRVGSLGIGDLAVWIGVSAAHRDEAFRACRYIIDEIKHRLPIWKKERYIDGDTDWVACTHGTHGHAPETALGPAHGHGYAHGHAHGHAAPAAADFRPDYSRQTRLPEVGAAGQARLAAARVLVIGAGGLGCPVLAYLAGAGVGTLGIVDGDRLEASNLHRQTLYHAADIGGRKAELARRHVNALNPAVRVQTWTEPLHAGNVVDVVSRFDLVLDCTDDMRSRYLSNDAALLTGTPLVLAGIYQYEGQLQVVSTRPGAPCLRCLWPVPPPPDATVGCVEAGVLGPVPGVLGAMQAMEALKILLDLPRQPDDVLLLCNLLDHSTQRLPIDTLSGCAGRSGCRTLAARALEEAGGDADPARGFADPADAVSAGFLLVDLRTAGEIDADPLPAPSRHIPFNEILERFDETGDARVLLVCASGRRSDHAARQLRQAGKRNVYTLAGGLNRSRGTASRPEARSPAAATASAAPAARA